MKNNIKISVIMGVYNPASQERLFRSVQSVIDQSFAEWELLLYDDGSQAPFTSLFKQRRVGPSHPFATRPAEPRTGPRAECLHPFGFRFLYRPDGR